MVVVANPGGSVTSSNALLTVLSASPTITIQPLSQTVVLGNPVSFNVQAQGTAPLAYQWFFGTNTISGATNSALNLTNAQFDQAGNYSVEMTGPAGNVTSSNALLMVQFGTNVFDLAADYSTSRNPNGSWALGGIDNLGAFHVFSTFGTLFGGGFTGWYGDGGFNWQTNFGGTIATTIGFWFTTQIIDNYFAERFTVPQGADGVYKLSFTTYYEYTGGVRISIIGQDIFSAQLPGGSSTGGITTGGTNFSYTTYLALKAGDVLDFVEGAGNYWTVEAVLSQPGAYTSITTQPTDQTVLLGSPATFNVTAGGFPPLIYEWMFGTNIIAGATNMILNLTNIQYAQAGNYSVLVTGPQGTVRSSNALLTVLVPVLPSITAQPKNQMVPFGGNATLTVGGAESLPFTYQWYVGASGNTSNPIAGATNSTFTTPQLFSSVAFWVAVQNAFGTAKSASALITLVPANSVLLGLELNAGSPSLTLFGTVGTTYRLEYVTDLCNTNWTPLLSMPLPSNPYRFTDSAATNPARFYRLRSSP